jgi:hypothetical protein
MVGITLSSEQVKNAPPEVRRWIEQEVLTAFGWHLPAAEPNEPHLVACTVEEAFRVFAAVRDMLPVANVFLTLGHQGANAGEGIEAFRIAEVMRHAHLVDPQQLVACLEVLNEAFRRVRNDATAVLCGADDRGYCYVAQETRRNIARVWEEAIALQNLKPREAAPDAPPVSQPVRVNYAPYTPWPARADSGAVSAQAREPERVGKTG